MFWVGVARVWLVWARVSLGEDGCGAVGVMGWAVGGARHPSVCVCISWQTLLPLVSRCSSLLWLGRGTHLPGHTHTHTYIHTRAWTYRKFIHCSHTHSHTQKKTLLQPAKGYMPLAEPGCLCTKPHIHTYTNLSLLWVRPVSILSIVDPSPFNITHRSSLHKLTTFCRTKIPSKETNHHVKMRLNE